MPVLLSAQILPNMFETSWQNVIHSLSNIPFPYSPKECVSMTSTTIWFFSAIIAGTLIGNKHLYEVVTRGVFFIPLLHFFAQILTVLLPAMLFSTFPIFFLRVWEIISSPASAILTQVMAFFGLRITITHPDFDNDEIFDPEVIPSLSVFLLLGSFAYFIMRVPLINVFPEQIINWFLLKKFTNYCPSAGKNPRHVIPLACVLAAYGASSKVSAFIVYAETPIATLSDVVLGILLNFTMYASSMISLVMVAASMVEASNSRQMEYIMRARFKATIYLGVTDGLAWVVRDCTSDLVRYGICGLLIYVVKVSAWQLTENFQRIIGTQSAEVLMDRRSLCLRDASEEARVPS